MIINATFDSSVNPASFDPTNLQQGAVEEAQFKNAINYVVDLYDHLFTNNVTVNIAFSWGEINGQTVAGRGTNKEHSVVESYADVLKALTTGAQSVVQKSADGMLPTVGDLPFGTGNSIALTYAQAKALDFMNAHGTESDGTVAFGAGFSWDFDPSASTPMGENDLVATAEHEISELMGRTSGDGRPDPHINNNPAWTVMDFFRYSSPGQRDTQPGTAASNSTAYFSVDGGNTNLGTWNNVVGRGDLGDWVNRKAPVPGGFDAFDAAGDQGKTGLLTTTDVTLMNVIGWDTNDNPDTAGGPQIVSLGVTDYVASGQTASNFVLEGGQQFIVSGGSATGTTVSAGVQDIRNGATAAGAQILHDGTQQIESGGAASDTVVKNYGTQDVDAGGSSVDTLIAHDGFQNVYAGGIIIDDGFDGGTQNLLSGATLSGVNIALGTQNVARGAAAGATELATGGVQNVSAGGKAVDTSVAGGMQNVYGTASDTTVDGGGTQDVWSGGTVKGTDVVFGAEKVFSGGTAGGTVLDDAGTQDVHAGATVAATVFDGGVQNLLSGAAVNGASIGSGTQNVNGGAVASNTTLDGGTQVISSTTSTLSSTVSGFNHSSTVVIPGTAQDTTIDGGGVQDIETGGLAIGSVLNGGSEYVEGGGTAYSTTISAGKLEVDSGGSVDGGVYFATGGSGTLLLDDSADLLPDSVSIAGFAHGDRLDLSDIAFGAQTTLAFAEAANNTTGTLTVSDGTHTANLLLIGQYMAANFGVASDSHGGTMITEGRAFLHAEHMLAIPHG